MSDASRSGEGACRCGQVRLRLEGRPLLAMACHCTGCQRMSASAYSLSLAMPSEGFSVVRGEPVIGGLHGSTRHYFCPHCMSWMFTRPEGFDMFVNVRPTMLDDAGWFSPHIETFTCEKLAWATTAAEHSFDTFPPFEAYEALTEEYRSRPDVPTLA